MPSHSVDTEPPRAGWSLLVPWLVLPAALAIITLVEWLRRRHESAPRTDVTTGG
jgi:hypothetical protein